MGVGEPFPLVVSVAILASLGFILGLVVCMVCVVAVVNCRLMHKRRGHYSVDSEEEGEYLNLIRKLSVGHFVLLKCGMQDSYYTIARVCVSPMGHEALLAFTVISFPVVIPVQI